MKLHKIFKILGKIVAIAAAVYAVLFAVFYFDLDGKLLYYVWGPNAVKYYDNMKHKDIMDTPYGQTDAFEKTL